MKSKNKKRKELVILLPCYHPFLLSKVFLLVFTAFHAKNCSVITPTSTHLDFSSSAQLCGCG